MIKLIVIKKSLIRIWNKNKIISKIIAIILDHIVVSKVKENYFKLDIYLLYKKLFNYKKNYEFERGYDTKCTKRYKVNYEVIFYNYEHTL